MREAFMMDFFYALPDIGIAAVFGLVMLLAVGVLPHILCRFIKIPHDNDTTDYAIRSQATVIAFLAIVLSFCLISAQNTLREVGAQASREASAINQMDRLLLRSEAPNLIAMRPLLIAYTESIVTYDWPLLEKDAYSALNEKSSKAFTPFSRAIFGINPTPGRQTEIYNQILKQIDLIAEGRAQRIQSVKIHLPDIFWKVILLLFVLLVVLAFLVKPTIGRSIAMGGQAFAIALLLSLVFVSNHPFKGGEAIKPTAFIDVIEIMKNRIS
jgi:hypothetical protein